LPDTQKNLYKKLLGKRGEIAAANYLKKSGYKIIERNYRAKCGEADIIALYDDTIIFIEVKTRSSCEYGLPCEAVNRHKQKTYIDIAKEYIYIKKLENINIRFDIIEVLKGKVNHIINAFQC